MNKKSFPIHLIYPLLVLRDLFTGTQHFPTRPNIPQQIGRTGQIRSIVCGPLSQVTVTDGHDKEFADR